MSRFVLVHGGSTGGECWDRLVPELEALGHTAVAPDLPGSGTRVAEKATLAGYRDAVVEVLGDADVVVGHSLAGYVATMAADAAPERIEHLVFMAAGVPIEGVSMLGTTTIDDLGMDRYVSFDQGPHGPQFALRSLDAARELFYNDLDPEQAEWAYARTHPQQIDPLNEPISVPRFWTSRIPRSYILCTRDRSGIVPIAGEQLERLGLDQAYLMDTGHYPFIRKPAETARLLDKIVRG